jgi:hypothetical protein
MAIPTWSQEPAVNGLPLLDYLQLNRERSKLVGSALDLAVAMYATEKKVKPSPNIRKQIHRSVALLVHQGLGIASVIAEEAMDYYRRPAPKFEAPTFISEKTKKRKVKPHHDIDPTKI